MNIQNNIVKMMKKPTYLPIDVNGKDKGVNINEDQNNQKNLGGNNGVNKHASAEPNVENQMKKKS